MSIGIADIVPLFFCLSGLWLILAQNHIITMKSMRRTARLMIVALFCIPYSSDVLAQRGAIELTAGAGVSTNSTPTDNMPYKGDRLTLNYSALAGAAYNIHRSISAGIEFRALELSRKSDATFTAPFNTLIGGDDRKLMYSKATASACGVFNGKLTVFRGYFYGGAAIGYGFSMHDYGRSDAAKESYRTPDGGSGLVWGVQAGYTHGLSKVLGINFEAALRNYSLNYDHTADYDIVPTTLPDLSYNITAYTFTVGLKIRIMPKYKAQNDIPGMRGKGRSAR